MPPFLLARLILVCLFAVVFYCGVIGLFSGQIRSRGYKFTRDANPIAYWSNILLSLAGPIVVVYLLLTR